MSTYTEQDCLDKIGQMKTWRENAGIALENRGAIEDSSNTKLADMPALIATVGDNGNYFYIYHNNSGRTSYSSTSGDSLSIVLTVKSNISWTVNVDSPAQTFTGTGDSDITISLNDTQPYGTYFYRVLWSAGGIEGCLRMQRYAINS